MAELRLAGLSKAFGDVQAVRGLDLDVAAGEFIVLLGPSGAGKTTTLRLVAGLEQPDAGAVHIGGHDVTALAPALRDVTFVFQQYSLYPHLNVYDNLAFPLRSPLRRTPEAEIRRKVTEVAQMLRIDDKLGSAATKLSGGQMQRVAIGRALVREPAVTLMDEPLSSLDAKLRNDLRLELKRIQQDLGATLLYVTHDQTEAMTLATRIGVLDRGALVQVGTPREIYRDPVSSVVAARLGSPRINLLPRAAAGSLPAPAAAATIGVRPDGSRLRPANGHDSGHAQAQVRRVEHLGDQTHVYVALGGGAADPALGGAAGEIELVALCRDTTGLEPGRAVSVEFNAPLYFDAAGQRITTN
jgi:multiple sugar transport system ATP-binding protein